MRVGWFLIGPLILGSRHIAFFLDSLRCLHCLGLGRCFRSRRRRSVVLVPLYLALAFVAAGATDGPSSSPRLSQPLPCLRLRPCSNGTTTSCRRSVTFSVPGPGPPPLLRFHPAATELGSQQSTARGLPSWDRMPLTVDHTVNRQFRGLKLGWPNPIDTRHRLCRSAASVFLQNQRRSFGPPATRSPSDLLTCAKSSLTTESDSFFLFRELNQNWATVNQLCRASGWRKPVRGALRSPAPEPQAAHGTQPEVTPLQ